MQIKTDQKQPENVQYFNHLGVVIRCTREIKFRVAMTKAAFNKKRNLFTSKLDLNVRKKLVNFCVWGIALYGTEI